MERNNELRFGCKLMLLVTSIMVALVAIDGYRGEGLSLQVIKVPVAAETDFGSRVWLGITNQGTEARLLCLGGWSYRTIAGTKPMIAGGESSPHGCGSIDSFQLILSKETAYMPILIPEATRAQSLVLEFTGTVVPYDLQRNEREDPLLVSWKGTLSDAASLGRRIFNK